MAGTRILASVLTIATETHSTARPAFWTTGIQFFSS
jgi:hypothetical protein